MTFQIQKSKIYEKIKLNIIKIKNLHSAKDIIQGRTKQATRWEKIFPKHISVKGLVSKMHKEFLKILKKTIKFLKWVKTGTEQTSHQRRY